MDELATTKQYLHERALEGGGAGGVDDVAEGEGCNGEAESRAVDSGCHKKVRDGGADGCGL